jgi:ATP-binding cassette subfamily B protein RaxB
MTDLANVIPPPSIGGEGAALGPLCKVLDWQPAAQLQQEGSDCGVAAVAALMAMYGHELCPNELRKLVGSTSRGLTVRNLRDLLRLAGFGAQVIRAEGSLSMLTRGPAIALWKKRHFVVLGKSRGAIQILFDPGLGWRRTRRVELDSELGDLAVVVTSVPGKPLLPYRRRFPLIAWLRLFPIHRILGVVCGGALLIQLLAIGLPWLTGKIVDNAVSNSSIATSTASSGPLLYFVAASIFSLVLRATSADVSGKLRQRLSTLISADISSRIFAKPIEYLRRHIPDVLGARVLGASQLQEVITDDVPMLIVNGLLVAGSLAMMSIVSPALALLAVLGVGIKSLVDYCIQPRLVELQEKEFWCRVRYQSTLIDSLRCAHAMRQYQAVSTVLDKLGTASAAHATAVYDRGRVTRIQQLGHGLIDVVDRTAFLVVGAWLIEKAGVSVGSFLALSLYRESLVAALDSLRAVTAHLNSARGAASRLEDVVTADTLKPSSREIAQGLLDDGTVAIRGVSFRYGRFSPLVISDLSLEIQDGESVALVAPTGTGKSTLAKLICGALSPSSGSIVVGGIDLKSERAEIAMRAVGTVMQDDALCSGSILENIEMFRGLSFAAVQQAARLVELHDWIETLPMRYETEVSDSVVTLSGGQRQRLLLARAICGHVRVLVMDEATSHLDVETERLIVDRIKALGVTTITFAHRPETIRRADRVIDLGQLLDSHGGTAR